ncbi:MAG: SH3 domain-containing protein [Opitutaceae bacterium]|nr:SH3 domain-containing protein [Opitutaceae bacterium]
MKINLTALLAIFAAVSLSASPVTAPTTVHARPDKSTPAIGILAAGTEPEFAGATAEPLPPGWEAVVITSNHDAYVAAKDVAKSLDVKIGSTLRTAPKADASVIGTMEPGDYAEIVGVKGKWTQLRLTKKRTGYIQIAGAAASAPSTSVAAAPAASVPLAPAPATPTASTFGGGGRPVQTVGINDPGSAALPRLFQGTFASTRRPLMPRRPYDYQLSDANGDRYAYLDISKLLLTEQIDKYIERSVVVYGTAKPVENTRDIVIVVESLQLR